MSLSNIDSAAKTAHCSLCNMIVTIRLRSDNGRFRCTVCERTTKYGLSPGQYKEMLQKQSRMCAICGTEMTNPQIDHDHNTQQVRQLLCARCNLGLGIWDDNVDNLLLAVSYLHRHKAVDTVAGPW